MTTDKYLLFVEDDVPRDHPIIVSDFIATFPDAISARQYFESNYDIDDKWCPDALVARFDGVQLEIIIASIFHTVREKPIEEGSIWYDAQRKNQ